MKYLIFLLIAIAVIGYILVLPRSSFVVKGVSVVAPPEMPKSLAVEITPTVYKIINCESQWKWVIGDLDYPHPAIGLIQVQQRTWDWLSKKLNFQGDINNAQDQIRFLTLALENGYGHYWSCARKLGI